MGPMHTYRAPYDGLVKGLTIGFSFVLGVAAVAMLVALLSVGAGLARSSCVLGLAGVLAILGLSYLLSPVGYRIEPHALVVVRPAGPLAFPLDGPVEAWRTNRMGQLTLRTWGDGGLFGGYGHFWNRDLGHFRAYVRRNRDFVVVRTQTSTVLVAPDDPERFLTDLADQSR